MKNPLDIVKNYESELNSFTQQMNDANIVEKSIVLKIRRAESDLMSIQSDINATLKECGDSDSSDILARRNLASRINILDQQMKDIRSEMNHVLKHSNQGESSSKPKSRIGKAVLGSIACGLIAAGVFVYTHNKSTNNPTPVVSKPAATQASSAQIATPEASAQDTSNKNETVTQKMTFPPLPEHTQKYYVIYGEGNRDNRTEMAVYDCADSNFTLDWKGGLYLSNNKKAINYVHYFLDGDKWTRTHWDGYDHISDWATSVYESSVDIYKKDSLIIKGTNK